MQSLDIKRIYGRYFLGVRSHDLGGVDFDVICPLSEDQAIRIDGPHNDIWSNCIFIVPAQTEALILLEIKDGVLFAGDQKLVAVEEFSAFYNIWRQFENTAKYKFYRKMPFKLPAGMEHLISSHLHRLPEADMRTRFMSQNKAAVDLYLDSIDYSKYTAFAIGDGRDIFALGELHKKDDATAEIAMSIEPEHQGKGYGMRLAIKLIEEASRQNIRVVELIMYRDNHRMRAIAEALGAKYTYHFDSIEGRIEI